LSTPSERADDETEAPTLGTDRVTPRISTQEINLNDVEAGGDIIVWAVQGGGAASTSHIRDVAEALVRGPLRVAGVEERARNADELRESGAFLEAASELVAIANELQSTKYELVAETYVDAAASLFEQAGDRPRAAEIFGQVVRARLDRFDLRAFNDAARLGRYLEEDARWVADGLAARAVWPEQPEAAIHTLERAWERARGGADELEWAGALVSVLLTLGHAARAFDVAADVRGRITLALGTTVDRERLGIELDYLESAARSGVSVADVEAEWSELLRRLTEAAPSDPKYEAWIWQRRAVSLFNAGRPDEGQTAMLRAIRAWSGEDGYEEEIREAFFSRERGITLSGGLSRDSAPLYSFAYALRGSRLTPATRAERLELAGLHYRLAKKWPDALRSYWLAYGIHRDAGQLYGQLDAANLLGELYDAAGEGHLGLSLFIEAGQERAAVDLAERVTPDVVVSALKLDGPSWQRAVSFAVVAAVGDSLFDEQVAGIAGDILGEARLRQRSVIGPDPGTHSRRALAAILLAVPADQFSESVEITATTSLTDHFTHREAVRALVRVTEADRYDATGRLTESLVDRSMPASGGLAIWIGQRVSSYPELYDRLRQAALDGNRSALEAVAIAENDPDPELSAVADALIGRFVGAEQEATAAGVQRVVTMGNYTDLGTIGRLCTPPLRAALLDRLLEVAENNNELQMNRMSAVDAVYNLATRTRPDDAVSARERLLRLARGHYAVSDIETSTTSGPFSRFKVSFDTGSSLDARALGTAAALTSGASLSPDELLPDLHAALGAADPQLQGAALQVFARFPDVPLPVTFDEASRHADESVRLAAYRALHARAALDESVLLRIATDIDRDIRGFALNAALAANLGARVAELLSTDPDAYIRSRARAALVSSIDSVEEERT
jgi:tetratricopeptide (TPR) repeat protein